MQVLFPSLSIFSYIIAVPGAIYQDLDHCVILEAANTRLQSYVQFQLLFDLFYSQYAIEMVVGRVIVRGDQSLMLYLAPTPICN